MCRPIPLVSGGLTLFVSQDWPYWHRANKVVTIDLRGSPAWKLSPSPLLTPHPADYCTPANTRTSANAGSMLAYRRRRCANLEPALAQSAVFVKSHFLLSTGTWWTPSKHGKFTQCCFNAGPPSSALAQHWNNIVWMSRVCRERSGHSFAPSLQKVSYWIPASIPYISAHIKWRINAVSILRHSLWRWPTTDTTLAERLVFVGILAHVRLFWSNCSVIFCDREWLIDLTVCHFG